MALIHNSANLTLLRAAQTLTEIPKTLRPSPLETEQELDAFYCTEVQSLRGVDRLGSIRLGLEDALADNINYKAFLMGHPGVGKTTELMRLMGKMSTQLRPLHLSVTSELNPGNFRFYDVLLLMLIRLVEAATDPTVSGFDGHNLDSAMNRVRVHLSTKWTKHLQTAGADWGIGLKLPFLALLGNLKQGRSMEHGEQEYEVSFVSELVDLMNDVLRSCNGILQSHKQQTWVILLEDFEKLGIAPAALRDLFVGLRPSLQDLEANILITIPVWLYFSDEAQVILPSKFDCCLLPDIAVYTKDHQIDIDALDALSHVVKARINPDLLNDGVLKRCVLASGGNVRDLFTLLRDSMISARLRAANTISLEDANGAVLNLRNDYKQRLGSTSANPGEATLEQKLDRLVEIYERKNPTADVPNVVLYSLLRQRFVLQYNGSAWKGVHPLAVDLLIEFGKLKANSPGGSGS